MGGGRKTLEPDIWPGVEYTSWVTKSPVFVSDSSQYRPLEALVMASMGEQDYVLSFIGHLGSDLVDGSLPHVPSTQMKG